MGWFRDDVGSDWPAMFVDRSKHPKPVGEFALLELVLAGIPRLPGARCRGHAALFDADAGEPARRDALALCANCRALRQCRNWVEAQPPGAIVGTWAGQYFAEPPTRKR